ncbi:MAG: hypothetical protein QOI66_743 [Myxococcales bacterium]|jgi:hypothetical protein|nr:hypothetical protein [Myxococcales bacterium]
MRRRALVLDLVLIGWLLVGGFLYLRQVAEPAMDLLFRAVGHRRP